MSEQVKEPIKKRSKAAAIFFLISMALLVCVNIFFLFKDPDPIDFAVADSHIIREIKRVSSNIEDVKILPYDSHLIREFPPISLPQESLIPTTGSREYIQITYVMDNLSNPLKSEGDELVKIVRSIATAKGVERFRTLLILFEKPTVDSKNNRIGELVGKFFFDTKELEGINWKGFTPWQLYNLAMNSDGTIVRSKYMETVRTYCRENEDNAVNFCKNVTFYFTINKNNAKKTSSNSLPIDSEEISPPLSKERKMPSDFRLMNLEEVIDTVEAFDNDITQAYFLRYNEKGEKVRKNEKGEECLIISYHPTITRNLLSQSAMGMKNIAQKVLAQEGSERFSALVFFLELSTFDTNNKEHAERAATFSWSRQNIKENHLNNEDDFLNQIESFVPNPIIQDAVLDYCSDEEHTYGSFCTRIVTWNE